MRLPGGLGPLRRGVRARTTAAAVVVVGLALLAGGGLMLEVLQGQLTSSAEREVLQRANDVAAILVDDPSKLDDAVGGDRSAAARTAAGGDGSVDVQVLTASGEVRAATPGPLSHRALPGVQDLAPGTTGEVRVTDDDPWVVTARDVPNGTSHLRVVVGESLSGVEENVQTTAWLLAAATPVLLVVVGLVTWRTAGRSLRPVEAIRLQVAGITSGTLSERVSEPDTRDEVHRLAGTMNRMLDRLEQAQALQRRFVADAGHELRNPLAAVRSAVEVHMPPDRTSRLVLSEVERLAHLVDDLLLLASADEDGLSPSRGDVDLDDLLLAERTRLAMVGAPAVDADIRPVRVSGDRRNLERAFRNLTANAVRHAESRVRLACHEDDGHAVVTVEDDGPGVPEPDRGRVFHRFTRLDNARARDTGGSGLGLAIVREIVTAHGGAVTVEDSPVGGARFVVRLPLPATGPAGRSGHPPSASR